MTGSRQRAGLGSRGGIAELTAQGEACSGSSQGRDCADSDVAGSRSGGVGDPEQVGGTVRCAARRMTLPLKRKNLGTARVTHR